MSIEELNNLSVIQAYEALEKCCGSSNWIIAMLNERPFFDEADVQNKADYCWAACDDEDGLEAFTHHPKIGDREALKEKFKSTAEWAGNEQGAVEGAKDEIIEELAKANKRYRQRFGFIFIVFATGKSAEEMLSLIKARMNNSPEEEIEIAKAEQHKITKHRLIKLLS